MKVVLFCGGLGMRIRDFDESIPKPLVPIGQRPILWHLMKYYAHQGHKHFILCLGYRGDAIRAYFGDGGRTAALEPEMRDWTITFVDTGMESSIGQRLKAVETYVDCDPVFLANYADGLSNVPIDRQLAHFESSGAVASLLCVRPNFTCHLVTHDKVGRVSGIEDISTRDLRINGGFFIFRREIFDYIQDGEELLVEPFHRLVSAGRLSAYRYDGFWMAMDTFKERARLEKLYACGNAPWQVWTTGVTGPA